MKLGSTLVGALAASASALAADIEHSTVLGHNLVPLAVIETGNRAGPPILFIHGYSQSTVSWERQLSDADLLKDFHLIAFDLRGHGASAKPTRPSDYGSEAWSGDVDAVIKAKAKRKPILVPWSYGGPVVMSYLRHVGQSNIAGVNFVAAGTALGGPQSAPNTDDPEMKARIARFTAMIGPDIHANLDATRWFVTSLTAKPLPAADMERHLITNMMTPAYVRGAMLQFRPNNADLKGKLTLPVLITHGDVDAVVPYQTALDNKAHLPHAELSTYTDIGHAPFLEDPARFNRELSAFVRRANAP
ncbi:MAG: alpha/beta hydrolase [Alphaproteobacteria bacterium]|nr:alpha/beta hydrolase [Alphaproteobacteria bacterium]